MTPFEQFKADYTGKKVLIFGLGLQGRGVGDAKVFASIGAKVTITDKKTSDQLSQSIVQLKGFNINYHLGSHDDQDIQNSDVIIRNASVPWNHPLLERARAKSIPIKMDAALFFEYAKPRAIGITGTRGKSTTANLLFDILKTQESTATLAGNAVSTASLELLKTHSPKTLYIFELSSWQLQAFHQEKISPHWAVLTNLHPDHLIDRDFDSYVEDKTAIFRYQRPTDITYLNQNDHQSQKLSSQIKSQLVWFNSNQVPKDWQPKIKGQHNLENIAACLKVAHDFGIDEAAVKTSVAQFSGLPFRLKPVATKNGITFINDSTSTTPIATIRAITTYPNSVLILGGTSKNLPVDQLANAINNSNQAVVLLKGSGTKEIKPLIDKKIIKAQTKSLEEAVTTAYQLASKNHPTVLFSPAFTSFELFENEFDRGQSFNQIVANL